MAFKQQTRNISCLAKRGQIFERNGSKLAFSKSTYDLWINSDSGEIRDVLLKLSKELDFDMDQVLSKIEKSKSDKIRIISGLSYEKSKEIKILRLNGVSISESVTRVYPNSFLAAHLIGHVNIDGDGLTGVEYFYNDILKGKDGKLILSTDASGRELPFSKKKVYDSIDGYDITLTIDEVIQLYMEEALSEALQENNAKSAMGIMMDVKTGEILAIASKPDFDLNYPRQFVDELQMKDDELTDSWNNMWRNPLISDLYEPGSIFKILTGAMALEEGLVDFDTEFYDKGFINVNGVTLRSWSWKNPHGLISFVKAMQVSSNPVFVELGQELGKEKFYEYLDDFGLTKKTGVALPAEAFPLINDQEDIGPVELATMTYGHGLSVTPIQMITAISAIGNNGMLMKPIIIRKIVNDDSELVFESKPEQIRKIISEKTAIDMRLILESVVTEGSGKKAYVPGYRIGGKTGTTNKLIDGSYSEDKVISSFVALAPIEEPKIALLILVDEPQSEHYGSIVAAPVAQKILNKTLKYLSLAPIK